MFKQAILSSCVTFEEIQFSYTKGYWRPYLLCNLLFVLKTYVQTPSVFACELGGGKFGVDKRFERYGD